MGMLVIAEDRGRAEALSADLGEHGIRAEPAPPVGPGAGGETGRIAAALIELEAALLARRPRAVLVAGSGDVGLAAAVVAAKLLVPVGWVPDAASAAPLAEADGRLLALLAERLDADSAVIAAWARDAIGEPPVARG